ncbi:MAG TPA: S8 family serine peptidase [Gemmatimonadales bacterium]|nr:S8 family serine peptidase [Gemmatimonadales bacterium]
MRLARVVITGMLTGLLGLAACQSDRAPTEAAGPNAPGFRSSHTTTGSSSAAASGIQYLVIGRGNHLPAKLADNVKAAGGTITASLPQIGVAIVSASNAAFEQRAAGIAGVEAIARDTVVNWISPKERVHAAPAPTAARPSVAPRAGVSARGIGDDELFFPLQWNLVAIHAPEAWAAGARGRGARVAVVDGGIYDQHVDLKDNIDAAHSASFVPGFAFNQDDDPDNFWHATFVAGVIAAEDNGIGAIGVAPEATIIGVKVLQGDGGSFGAVIQGILYAATPIAEGGAGADIINLSLGAVIPRQGKDFAQLAAVVSRAVIYAHQRGVTVLAAAGNDALDLDHSANLISIPAQSTDALAISALGPVGFGLGATNFDRLASYSEFGQSAIAFGAPGGDFVLDSDQLCGIAVTGGTAIAPCPFFDLVLSTGRGTSPDGEYFFADGTSVSTPAAAGVAALIIGKFGHLDPARLEARLRASADDLGKPGNDDAYGQGRVNAFRAVQ